MKERRIKDLDKNLTFESLLGKLSAELVNISLESIDAAIESNLKKLVEFFDADRCHLGELLTDESKIDILYFYSRSGINIPQTTDVGKDYLSFVYEHIRENKLLAFAKSAELPKEANKDRNELLLATGLCLPGGPAPSSAPCRWHL